MKQSFVLACLTAAYTAEAGIIDQLIEFRSKIPRTQEDARKKFGRVREFKTSPQHRIMAEQAHTNVRAQRERLGLAPLTADGRGGNLKKSYEDLGGFSGYILGVAKGLQYNQAAGPSPCFNAVEATTVAGSNLFFILSKIYQPWYVPEAQLVV